MRASFIDMRVYCDLHHTHSDCTLILSIIYEYMNMDMKHPSHEVSSILQTLLKDGALRTNIPKLSAFSGERAKGEVSL